MSDTDDLHPAHQVRLSSDAGGFWGTCSCGERSPRFTAAGFVSGWEARHREEATRRG